MQRSFRNLDLAASNWLTLRFPAEPDSSGQLYVLTATGSTADGIRLGYSEKPEYLSGRLMENGASQGSDILFQYGCVAGLQSLASTPALDARRLAQHAHALNVIRLRKHVEWRDALQRVARLHEQGAIPRQCGRVA